MHPKTGQKMTRRNVNRNLTPATNKVQNARSRASSTNESEERNANHTGHRDQESSDRNQYAPGKITITFKKPPNMYRRKGVVTSNANLICKPTTGGQVQRKEPDNPKKETTTTIRSKIELCWRVSHALTGASQERPNTSSQIPNLP